MQPLKITLKNIGPYNDATLSFKEVSGEVVAITGLNGGGKTFLVDSVYCALYRTFPSRENVYKYCRPDAQITFDFSANGNEYRTVLNINPKKREMEPWLMIKTGPDAFSPLTDGKNGTFDTEIAKLVGTGESTLASVFASQNKNGSFISLKKADRKDLFIDMLGLGKLQLLSEAASTKEVESKNAYEALWAKTELLKSAAEVPSVDIQSLAEQLDSMREKVVAAEDEVSKFTSELAVIQSSTTSLDEVNQKRAAIEKKISAIKKDKAEADRAVSETTLLVGNIDDLRLAALDHDAIERDLAKSRSDQASLSAQVSAYHRDKAKYTQAVSDLEKEKSKIKSSVNILVSKIERAGSDSSIIDTVPCQGIGDCAECQFLVGAIKARDSVSDLEAERDNSSAELLIIDQKIKELSAPDPTAISAIQSRLQETERKVKEGEKQLAEATAAKNKLARAESAIENLESLKGRSARLAEEASTVGLELSALDDIYGAAQEGQSRVLVAQNKLGNSKVAMDDAKSKLNISLANLSRAEAQKQIADKAKLDIEALTPQLTKIERDRKQWSMLAKSFGKSGIQSLEIDASGPAVSEICNDLLFSCFGPRFAVRFITQSLKADNSGYRDDFDIYVSDADNNREGSIDDLSGGERVIVAEAVSLAISLFNRSLARTGWSSIWRDEAAGALDKEKSMLYIKMLRRARELGHFDRLFFIEQQAIVTENADSKITVSHGKVSME